MNVVGTAEIGASGVYIVKMIIIYLNKDRCSRREEYLTIN